MRNLVLNLPSDEYCADLGAALEAQQHESLFNLIDLRTGWKIDLIFRKSRLFSRQEFARRQSLDLQGRRLYVASVEDVIVAKLEWAMLAKSQRQIEDTAAILRLRWEALDRPYRERRISDLGLEDRWSIARRAAGLPEASG